ncbi:MAG: FHA domain-containing protein [Propionibacteriaceae bacterium]|nr:FHA domain-containing protein [Propionibacteriaceae bacterium]
MTEQIGLWRATYSPGQWVVLGGPTSLVVLQPAPADRSELVTSLWRVVVQAVSLDALVAELARYNIMRMPDFAAFFWHDNEMRSLVRGEIEVIDLDSGEPVATGEGVQTWTEVGLGDLRRVRVSLGGDRGAPEVGLHLPLVVGAVTAGALVLDATDQALVASPQVMPPAAAGPQALEGDEFAAGEDVVAAMPIPGQPELEAQRSAVVDAQVVEDDDILADDVGAERGAEELEPEPEQESAVEAEATEGDELPPVLIGHGEINEEETERIDTDADHAADTVDPPGDGGVEDIRDAAAEDEPVEPAGVTEDAEPAAPSAAAAHDPFAMDEVRDPFAAPEEQGEPFADAGHAAPFAAPAAQTPFARPPAQATAGAPGPFARPDAQAPAAEQPAGLEGEEAQQPPRVPGYDPHERPPAPGHDQWAPGGAADRSAQPVDPQGQAGQPEQQDAARSEQPVEQKSGDGMVLGVSCGAGHPNPPDAQRCRRCGGPLQGQPRMMPRPVMALLRPSSGEPVEVDRSVLIGRSPQANKLPREDLPKLLTVVSPSTDISRTHLQVSPDGWEVVATDLHSTNGTLLIRPGQPEPERLPAGEPVHVFPGCVLDLGDGVSILVDHPV